MNRRLFLLGAIAAPVAAPLAKLLPAAAPLAQPLDATLTAISPLVRDEGVFFVGRHGFYAYDGKRVIKWSDQLNPMDWSAHG